TPPPKDRFDDLPADHGRIGAHRAENPRMRGGVVLLWSVIATVVLVALGVFGSMIATGRITLFPTPEPTVTVAPTAEAVLDTSYAVTVLNATPQRGLAAAIRDTVIAAEWPADSVLDGDAGSEDFPTTTVYYATPADEGAARGLAQAIGGADVQLNDVYQPVDDPDTTDVDESATKQLVIVIGLDRTDAGQATPAP
ncbi:MAG TPA: LytR C-terminal domain-containing protein, partial [Microbacterium sp.]|nr:LytR C-terminal domain-containing protein [Microbacterium sp.]